MKKRSELSPVRQVEGIPGLGRVVVVQSMAVVGVVRRVGVVQHMVEDMPGLGMAVGSHLVEERRVRGLLVPCLLTEKCLFLCSPLCFP